MIPIAFRATTGVSVLFLAATLAFSCAGSGSVDQPDADAHDDAGVITDGGDDSGSQAADDGSTQEADDGGSQSSDDGFSDAGQADDGMPAGSICKDYQTVHPEWLWCDDFEDGVELSDKYPDIGSTGMDVSDEDALSATHSLRQHYEQAQVSAGWVSFFYGDTLGHDYGPNQKEIYMRWYHKFESGFDGFPPKMARITSLGPGWEKRFGVHFWISDGEIVADVKAPYSTQANDAGWLAVKRSGFHFTDQDNVGRWICFEMHVRANTPGQADGAYVFWADGQKIIDAQGVDLVGSTDYHFNNAMLDCYWNDGSPKVQNRYYDAFVVSTERIGCQ